MNFTAILRIAVQVVSVLSVILEAVKSQFPDTKPGTVDPDERSTQEGGTLNPRKIR